MKYVPGLRPPGILMFWFTLKVPPEEMFGVAMLASRGSLIVTVVLEAAMRMWAVEGLAVPLPWLRIMQLTVTLELGCPPFGLTARFWVMRSGRDGGGEVTVN